MVLFVCLFVLGQKTFRLNLSLFFFFFFEAGIYLLLRSSFVDNVNVNSPLAASSCNEHTWKRS